MSPVDRRSFLQYLSGAALTSTFVKSIEKAVATPAHFRTGTIEDVEHVVFLMQENRAFDHYFGTMRGVRGYGDTRPALLPSGKPVWFQPDGNGYLLPYRPAVADMGMQFLEDTAHSWPDTQAAWNGGRYDQWIANKGRSTMAYLDAEGHSVSLRAGRCVHRLRCLLLLLPRLDRSQPLSHVDGLARERRAGRRSGHQQCRGRLRLVDVSGAPRARRHLLEDLPGHRHRLGCRRIVGLDGRSAHRQLRRQLAPVFPSVSERAARQPAGREGSSRHEHRRPGGVQRVAHAVALARR